MAWWLVFTLLLVGVLAAVAGGTAVSFRVVSDLAEQLGFHGWVANMFQPLIEVFLLLGSLEIVLRVWDHHRGGNPGLPPLTDLAEPGRLVSNALWVTCALNVIGHFPPDWIAQVWIKLPLGAAMSALIPIATKYAIDLLLRRVERMGAPTDGIPPAEDREALAATITAKVDADTAALAARVDTEVDALRELLAAIQTRVTDPDEITRQVDTRVDARVDASTRQQVAAVARDQLAGLVDAQVSTLRVHLDRQAASTAERVDTRVDTAVRAQLRQALPELSQQITDGLRAELDTRAQQAASTIVQQGDPRRELRGRASDGSGDGGVRAAIIATYTANPDPEAWSKRSLARAAGYPGSTTVAQNVLDAARRGELPARPDASTPQSTPDIGEVGA